MTMTLSLVAPPAWASISASGVLSIAPTAPLGAQVLTVRATDGIVSATSLVAVNVQALPRSSYATLAKPLALALQLAFSADRRYQERLASKLALDFSARVRSGIARQGTIRLTAGSKLVADSSKLASTIRLGFASRVQPPAPPLTYVPSYYVSFESTDVYTGDSLYSSAPLTDGDWATGYALTSSPPDSTVCVLQADFSQAYTVASVRVAGGYVGASYDTNVAAILNGATLQWSPDGVSGWTTVGTVVGATDVAGDYVEITLSSPIAAIAWRLRRSGRALGTTMLMFML